MMDQRVKKMWIDALRSGEYQQTTSKLKLGNSFCCLGVLTDLYNKETGKGSWKELSCVTIFASDDDYTEEYMHLPREVQKWAGLPKSPSVRYSEARCNLTNLNDGTYEGALGTNVPRHSFFQIAQFIEDSL
jgi:hypothetical protein